MVIASCAIAAAAAASATIFLQRDPADQEMVVSRVELPASPSAVFERGRHIVCSALGAS
jgi:hypothetical protein